MSKSVGCGLNSVGVTLSAVVNFDKSQLPVSDIDFGPFVSKRMLLSLFK